MNETNLGKSARGFGASLVAHGGIDWTYSETEETSKLSPISMDTITSMCDYLPLPAPPCPDIIAQIKFVPQSFGGTVLNRKSFALKIHYSVSPPTLVPEEEAELINPGPNGQNIYTEGLLGHYRLRPPEIFEPLVSPHDRRVIFDHTIDQQFPYGNWVNPRPYVDPDASNPFAIECRNQFSQFFVNMEAMIGSRIKYYLLHNEQNNKIHPDLYAKWVQYLSNLTSKPIILGNVIPEAALMDAWFSGLDAAFNVIYGDLRDETPPPFRAAAIDLYTPPYGSRPYVNSGDLTSMDNNISIWKGHIETIYNKFHTSGQPIKWIVKEAGFWSGWNATDLQEINALQGGTPLRRDLKQRFRRFMTYLWRHEFEHVVWFNHFQTDRDHGTLSLIQANGDVMDTKLGAFVKAVNASEFAEPTIQVSGSGVYEPGTQVPFTITFPNNDNLGVVDGEYIVELTDLNSTNPSVQIVANTSLSFPEAQPCVKQHQTPALTTESIYRISVKFDPDDSLFDTCYQADALIRILDTGGLPGDFSVDDITWTPTTVRNGDDVTFKAKISFSNSPSSALLYYADLIIDGVQYDRVSEISIPSNSSVWVEFDQWPATLGSHSVKVAIFALEPDANDSRTETLQVLQAILPDLTLQSISGSGVPVEGTPFTVLATVKNMGTAASPPCDVAVKFSAKPSGVTVAYFAGTCPSISPGSQTVVSINGTAPAAGLYKASVILDPLNVVQELNETFAHSMTIGNLVIQPPPPS